MAEPNPAPRLPEPKSNWPMLAFAASSKPLLPHFAYGDLSKQEYELAHAMHLADHPSAFRARA